MQAEKGSKRVVRSSRAHLFRFLWQRQEVGPLEEQARFGRNRGCRTRHSGARGHHVHPAVGSRYIIMLCDGQVSRRGCRSCSPAPRAGHAPATTCARQRQLCGAGSLPSLCGGGAWLLPSKRAIVGFLCGKLASRGEEGLWLLELDSGNKTSRRQAWSFWIRAQ